MVIRDLFLALKRRDFHGYTRSIPKVLAYRLLNYFPSRHGEGVVWDYGGLQRPDGHDQAEDWGAECMRDGRPRHRHEGLLKFHTKTQNIVMNY
jgi:hypothetical protein